MTEVENHYRAKHKCYKAYCPMPFECVECPEAMSCEDLDKKTAEIFVKNNSHTDKVIIPTKIDDEHY